MTNKEYLMTYLEKTEMEENEIETMLEENGIEANADADKRKCKTATCTRMASIIKSAAKYNAKWNMDVVILFYESLCQEYEDGNMEPNDFDRLKACLNKYN